MRDSRISGHPGRKNTVAIRRLNRSNAVCRHQDRTVERCEFHILTVPGIPVISIEVRILFEFGIGVRRKHFRMRVNINTRIFRLLQQLFQIAQIMTGNQDSRTRSDTRFHRCDPRCSISSGIGRIQQSHRFDGNSATLQHQSGQLICGTVAGGRRQRFEQKRINVIIFPSEHGGMFGISGNPFQTVRQQFPQGPDVFVSAGQYSKRSFGIAVAGQRLCPRELRINPRLVEIGIGDRHEKRLYCKPAQFTVRFPGQSQQFQLTDQFIHLIGECGIFSTGSANGTSGIPDRLLTLKTKHRFFHNILLICIPFTLYVKSNLIAIFLLKFRPVG